MHMKAMLVMLVVLSAAALLPHATAAVTGSSVADGVGLVSKSVRLCVASAQEQAIFLPLANISTSTGLSVENSNGGIDPNDLARQEATCADCNDLHVWTDETGCVNITCAATCFPLQVNVTARQYQAKAVTVNGSSLQQTIALTPRHISSQFPTSHWMFHGFPVEVQTGTIWASEVGRTKGINFMAHPSVYRTPSGRIFMTFTANTDAGPGWTAACWQDSDHLPCKVLPHELLNTSHPYVLGIPFSARMLSFDGRLLMLLGMPPKHPDTNYTVTLLENTNLNDPSHSSDWGPAANTSGYLSLDVSSFPDNITTFQHEDFRLHVFDDRPMDALGRRRRYWMFVIPDDPDYNFTGRACGRAAFTSDTLAGPYSFGGWVIQPAPENCLMWPGDVLETKTAWYFVGGWGQLFRAQRQASRPLVFERVSDGGNITLPAPTGAWDDAHQIEFTFLPPPTAAVGGKVARDVKVEDGLYAQDWRLYHASYSNENYNAHATRADYGYKQAIGMYTFQLDE